MLATFKVGSRILTYNRLEDMYASFQKLPLDGEPSADSIAFPWRRLRDRYGVRSHLCYTDAPLCSLCAESCPLTLIRCLSLRWRVLG